jgi:molybdopterin biosynthesis enzyme
MTGALTGLDAGLARLAPYLGPVAAVRLPPADATGAVLAEPLVAPAAVPAVATALTDGVPVLAADLVGAGPWAPVPLSPCQPVRAGDPMPPGTDAILPPDAVDRTGPMPLALAEAMPGLCLRAAGADLAAGHIIAPAGLSLTAVQAATALLAGLTHADVRRPAIRLTGAVSGPAADLLAHAIRRAGAVTVAGPADLVVGIGPVLPDTVLAGPLAIEPGEATMLGLIDGRPAVIVPDRPADAMAVFLLLLCPALDRLAARAVAPASDARPLTRKITGPPGRSAPVWLTESGRAWLPLAVGDAPLHLLSRATAFAILPAGSEGLPEGALLEGCPL